MQSTDFSASLQPRSGSFPHLASYGDSSTTSPRHTNGGLNGTGYVQDIQTPKTPAKDVVLGFRLPDSPEARERSFLADASPTCYTPSYSPAYQAGVVQALGSFMPPPPVSGRPHGLPSASAPPSAFAFGSPTPTDQRARSSATLASWERIGADTPRTWRGAEDGSRTPAASVSPPRGGRTVGGTGGSPMSPAARKSLRHAGSSKNAPSSRIDPEQVPRPVGPVEAVKEEGGKVYDTTKYHVPPLATAVCTIVDKGSSSCEFMRSTVNQVPSFPSTANTSHVPLALVCQPFAELTASEDRVPLVNCGEPGPFRCTRCKAYVNSFFTWQSQGREATCNMCGQRLDVPDDYLCSLNENGVRRDYDDRPELQRGTVDYVAPRDYSDERLPGKPAVAIVVDASARSVQSGLFHQALWTLRTLLAFPQEATPRIALITFDHALHFYAIYPGQEVAHSITVVDIEDPFVPRGHAALCVDVEDATSRAAFEALLERLPADFAGSASSSAAGGAALKAATDLLAVQGGGHVIMFHASLPNTGLGALRVRDDFKLLGNIPEGSGLFSPQQAPFYEEVAKDCLASGVAVSVFVCPERSAYLDVATLSLVPRRTGGDIVHIPGFDVSRDGEQLHHNLARMVVQGAAYSCVFKLRCSKGLNIDTLHATWDAEVIDQSTFAVSRLSTDSTGIFALSHGERLEGQKHVYMQAACLYTDKLGRRLIRVHTLQLPVTTSVSSVFRFADIYCVTSLLLKQSASAALVGDGRFKDKLTKACVDMLFAYRINCASNTASGQLILPESLKLLPLFACSIRKMPVFRTGSDLRVDERMAGLVRILALPIAQIPPLVYTRVHTVLPVPESAGRLTGVGANVNLPQTIACSVDKMYSNWVYLVDNGLSLYIYIRDEAPAEMLQEAFGVATAAEVPAALAKFLLPEAVVSHEGQRLWAIVQQIRRDRCRLPWQPLYVALPGTPEEARVLAMLIEDRVSSELPYVDYLCHVHKKVQHKVD